MVTGYIMIKKEIVILSGFLGTGKTTILQNIIDSSNDKKIAVLLNDFGDVPVDGALINHNGKVENISSPVMEIGGGSVFCSCLKEAFVKALFSLSTSNAERVIVEASGMSDPSGVTKMLSLAKLDTFYDEALVICLFDPQKSLKLSNVLEVIPRQIKAANVVVLTKSDITTSEERQQARDYIKSVNASVPVVESYNGILNLENLPQISVTANATLTSLLTFNTPETRPDSFVIDKEINELQKFIKTLSEYESLLRVKGFVKTNKGIFYITDSPMGIIATEADKYKVPLTVICMQNEGSLLQEKLMNFLQ